VKRHIPGSLESHDFALSVASQGFVSFSNFALMFLLLRSLSLEEFGYFALISTISIFCQQVFIGNLLINPYINISSRLFHALAHYEKAFYTNALALIVIIAVGATLTLTALRGMGSTSLVHGAATACYFFVFGASELLRRQLSARGFHRFMALAEACRAIGTVILIGMLASTGRLGLINSIFVIVVFSLLYCIAAGLRLSMRIGSSYITATTKRHLREGGGFMIAGVFASGKDTLLQVLVAAIFGEAALGSLRAAQLPFGLANPILTSLDYFMPKTLRRELDSFTAKQFRVKYRNRLLTYTFVFGMYVGAIALAAITVMPVLVTDKAPEPTLIWLFALNYALMMAVGLTGIYVRILSLFKPALTSEFFAAAFSVLAFVLTAPIFGLASAILGAVVGYFTSLTLLAYRVLARLEFFKQRERKSPHATRA
jgi:O-antigen/teichoic acid export membrane protein